MDIRAEREADALRLTLAGRLDAAWCGALQARLDELVRAGERHVRLDMGQVDFISSSGIRVLLKAYKDLRTVGGTLGIEALSETVREVLDMSGLTSRLVLGDSSQAASQVIRTAGRRCEVTGATFTVHHLSGSAGLACELLGDPRRLDATGFSEGNCVAVDLPASALAVGLGAAGGSFAECRPRFGEVLAAGGLAAYLPADAPDAPDYLIMREAFVPRLQMLYALVMRGSFTHFANFESLPGNERGSVALSQIVRGALELSGTSTIGLVMLAESAGLVGAALKRSPAQRPGGQPSMFAFPAVRATLSFTSERAHPRSLALVGGIATTEPGETLAPFVRPVGAAGQLFGHLHAAVFTYRALATGVIPLTETLSTLADGERLLDVLHLLGDYRDFVGCGESEFVRGAAWFGPVVTAAPSAALREGDP